MSSAAIATLILVAEINWVEKRGEDNSITSVLPVREIKRPVEFVGNWLKWKWDKAQGRSATELGAKHSSYQCAKGGFQLDGETEGAFPSLLGCALHCVIDSGSPAVL